MLFSIFAHVLFNKKIMQKIYQWLTVQKFSASNFLSKFFRGFEIKFDGIGANFEIINIAVLVLKGAQA
jgi:hypothetical protein